MAISDVFLVKAAATALARGTITLAAKYAVKQAVKNPVLTVREAAAMANLSFYFLFREFYNIIQAV